MHITAMRVLAILREFGLVREVTTASRTDDAKAATTESNADRSVLL